MLYSILLRHKKGFRYSWAKALTSTYNFSSIDYTVASIFQTKARTPISLLRLSNFLTVVGRSHQPGWAAQASILSWHLTRRHGRALRRVGDVHGPWRRTNGACHRQADTEPRGNAGCAGAQPRPCLIRSALPMRFCPSSTTSKWIRSLTALSWTSWHKGLPGHWLHRNLSGCSKQSGIFEDKTEIATKFPTQNFIFTGGNMYCKVLWSECWVDEDAITQMSTQASSFINSL